MSTLEIERKFLVKNIDFKDEAFKSENILQGFLSSIPERTVRIRIKGKIGFITIKGIGNESGTTRFEWEQKIPLKDANELMKICEPGVIYKTRFYVKNEEHIYEIDEFLEENKGLIVAELELTSEGESFKKPNWLGKEVTGIIKYYNSSLVKHPFKDW